MPENTFLGEITVDKVTVQIYADQASLMMALASGECDAYYNYANPIEATLIDSFTGMDGLDMGESPFAGSYQMLFGCSRTPGDDVNFPSGDCLRHRLPDRGDRHQRRIRQACQPRRAWSVLQGL